MKYRFHTCRKGYLDKYLRYKKKHTCRKGYLDKYLRYDFQIFRTYNIEPTVNRAFKTMF